MTDVSKSYLFQINAINPKPFLTDLVNKNIVVRLEWGIEYTGKLLSYDKYFNLQLANSEEYVEGNCRGSLGEILIRCNNVLYVREMPEEQDY